jgi:hypothetical protein
MNVDQYYSIYDQLDAGSRYIRIDPVSYAVADVTGADTELRVCHQSGTSQTVTQLGCNLTACGRLFAYALAEVADWLHNNPGEVIFLRLNRTARRKTMAS